MRPSKLRMSARPSKERLEEIRALANIRGMGPSSFVPELLTEIDALTQERNEAIKGDEGWLQTMTHNMHLEAERDRLAGILREREATIRNLIKDVRQFRAFLHMVKGNGEYIVLGEESIQWILSQTATGTAEAEAVLARLDPKE